MNKTRADKKHEHYVTRQEGIEAAHKETGVPLKRSRVDKDVMTGLAPKPAAYFGKRPLYRRDDFIAYARSLVSPKPRRLRGSRSGRLDTQADRNTSTTKE